MENCSCALQFKLKLKSIDRIIYSFLILEMYADISEKLSRKSTII